MLMHFHHVSDGNVLFPVNFYFSGWALFWAKFSQIKSSWSETIQSKHFHNILLWGHQHQHLLYLIIVSMTMASSHFQTLFIVPIFFFFPKYIIYKYNGQEWVQIQCFVTYGCGFWIFLFQLNRFQINRWPRFFSDHLIWTDILCHFLLFKVVCCTDDSFIIHFSMNRT